MFGTSKEDKMKNAKDNMADEGSDAADAVKDAAHCAGKQAGKIADCTEENLAKAGKAFMQKVCDNPVKTGMVAFGLGLVVSTLVRRRQA